MYYKNCKINCLAQACNPSYLGQAESKFKG